MELRASKSYDANAVKKNFFCKRMDNVKPINTENVFQLLVKPGIYLEFLWPRLCYHYCE